MLYNVYANMGDGRGVSRVNSKPIPVEKANGEAQRLQLGKLKLTKVFVVKAVNGGNYAATIR